MKGFTLTELGIVLLIVALLLGGLLPTLTKQIELQRTADTQKYLADAKEALLGFAAANGRLPCPASATSNGQESWAAGGNAGNGLCSNFYDGFLPAAALGLTPVDQNGYAIDAWNQPQNRIHYAVYAGTFGAGYRLTASNGMKNDTMATMSSYAGSNQLLSVCASATGITNIDCGTALALTKQAPAVIFSLGNNAPGGTGLDEAANQNSDPVFIYHEPTPSSFPNGEFDDIVTWLSLNTLFNRMVAAGQLP